MSPKELLEECLGKISDEFGICFKQISIEWIDADNVRSQKRIVDRISATCEVIYPERKGGKE